MLQKQISKLFCMKILFTFLLGFLICWNAFAQQSMKINPDDLKQHVEFLASDSLKGRKPGTPETAVAARYILQEFKSGGLMPMCDDGFQYFDVITDVRLGENMLTLGENRFEVMEDFIPLAFSSSGGVDAGIVFAGFGFDIDQDSLQWNEYEAVDVDGKWVMIFRADPEPDNSDSQFIPFAGIRSKVLTAKDKGAIGVLLVTPRSMEKNDKLISLIVENNDVTAGITVIHIKRSVADMFLQPVGFTADSLDALIIDQMKPNSLELPGKVSARVEVIRGKDHAMNVVALLEGSDPVLKKEYLVVGAHYDHLGIGGPNSGSRMPDTNAVHNGADDNASGTAMVIELGKALAKIQSALGRSIIFVAFSAEEMGLLGSKYFVNNPPVPGKAIKAMFNFDMVGRFDKEKNSISVSGTGSSVTADSILKVYEDDLPFKVTHAPDGYGPSDHAAFYAANIPVFFFNTGVHIDYHTPFDDTEFLDFETSALVGDFAADVILAVDKAPEPLAFKASGSQKSSGRIGRKVKVTLGIMPDFAGTEKKGLRIDGVTKGKPAELGGMLKGDIIISINGMNVGNIYEYMSRLTGLKFGQTINVEVIRGDKNEVLLIQL